MKASTEVASKNFFLGSSWHPPGRRAQSPRRLQPLRRRFSPPANTQHPLCLLAEKTEQEKKNYLTTEAFNWCWRITAQVLEYGEDNQIQTDTSYTGMLSENTLERFRTGQISNKIRLTNWKNMAPTNVQTWTRDCTLRPVDHSWLYAVCIVADCMGLQSHC